MTLDELPDICSTADLAAYWGVDRDTIGDLCRDGRLRSFQVGSLWKIRREDVREYEDRQRCRASADDRRRNRRVSADAEGPGGSPTTEPATDTSQYWQGRQNPFGRKQTRSRGSTRKSPRGT